MLISVHLYLLSHLHKQKHTHTHAKKIIIMRRDVRKPVSGLNQTDLLRYLRWLEVSDLGRIDIVRTIRVARTKALISFAVTAKLICAFVFAELKITFSHDAAQMVFVLRNTE